MGPSASHDASSDESAPAAKSRRAPAEAQKARPVKLLATDTVEDAAVCVFSAALDHFEANLPLFLSRQPPESVHQMRVALRRLRAAIGTFRGALSGPTLDAARDSARSLASTLGKARNWDVFQDMLAEAPAEALRDDPSYRALLDAVELRRDEAYRSACEAVGGAQVPAFIADFREALAKRDWAAQPGVRDAGSARDFARAALSRLRKRVLKKARGLAELAPEQRHQVRIAIKKARYGAEFFESLFSKEDAEAFSTALAELQDGLGGYNDMKTADTLLHEIDARSGAPLRASGFVRGWFAHAAQEGVAHARRSEKRLKKLEPFWE
jgi:CHAD domain-containing protein